MNFISDKISNQIHRISSLNYSTLSLMAPIKHI